MRLDRLAFAVGTVGATLLATACDGGDDNQNASTPTLNSGLEEKTLSSLTQSEIDQLNKAVGDYMGAAISKQGACKMAGFSAVGLAMFMGQSSTDAELQKACSDMASTCNNAASTATESTTSNQVTPAELANCEATVSEFEACERDSVAALNAMMQSLPDCSEITASMVRSESDATSTVAATPESCAAFQTKCPEVPTDPASTESQ